MGYEAVKGLHTLFALISIVFFNFRFWLFFTGPRPPIMRILPHTIDTIFLVLGVVLVIMRYYYYVMPAWLWVKLLLLVGYIFFGIIAMRQKFPPITRYAAYGIADAMVAVIIFLAFLKPDILGPINFYGLFN